MVMDCYQAVLNLLASEGVAYAQHDHGPVRTVAEVEARLPFTQDRMLKTIAFRLKDGRYVLAGLRGHDRIDYRRLAAHFGINRRAVASMAPQDVETELGFEVGGVGPFALQPGVVLLLDERLAAMERIYCGSGKNSVTLGINFADLLRVSGGELVRLARHD